jgi:hypothetical protein
MIYTNYKLISLRVKKLRISRQKSFSKVLK